MRAYAIAGLTFAAVAVNQDAHAFNSDEHKMIGDVATAQIPACSSSQSTQCVPVELLSSRLAIRYVSGGWAKIIDSSPAGWAHTQISRLTSQYPASSGWYNVVHYLEGLKDPTDAWTLRREPLVVWAGKATDVPLAKSNHRQYFTFGDLVALYGDYRWAVNCDNAKLDCSIAPSTRAEFVEPLHDIARGLVPPFGSAGNAVSDAQPYDPSASSDPLAWWGDEMMRLAKVNDWHFGERAVRHYAAMHRIALTYAFFAAYSSKPEFLWLALHYEANALHSLTDLFAPGHILVGRGETVDDVLAVNAEPGARTYIAKLKEFSARTHSGPATLAAPSARVSARGFKSFSAATHGKVEAEHHDASNKQGAFVKNLWAEDPFVAFGDGRLFHRVQGVWVNKTQWDWAVLATKTSLLSVFDAYRAFVSMGKDNAVTSFRNYTNGAAAFASLRYVPVQVRDACFEETKCYPATVSTWMNARYTETVAGLAGMRVPRATALRPWNGTTSAQLDRESTSYATPMSALATCTSDAVCKARAVR